MRHTATLIAVLFALSGCGDDEREPERGGPDAGDGAVARDLDAGDAQVPSMSIDGSLRDASIDAAPAPVDASVRDDAATFVATFPARVRAAVVGGSPVNQCLVFPSEPVYGATREDARYAVFSSLAIALMTTNRLVEEGHVSVCGVADQASCSSRFERDVLAGGGDYSTRLRPLAEEVEAQVAFGEMTSWTVTLPSGIMARATCIAGTLGGALTGVCVVSGLASCP